MKQSRIMCITLAAAALAAGSTQARAQRPPAEAAAHEQLMSELARLREAASLEATGNLAGAEQIIRDVLRSNPLSLTALLSLERVLNLTGRTSDLIPPVDLLLSKDPSSVVAHQLRLRVLSEIDDDDRLQDAVNAWIKATPTLEPPYREGAAVYRRRGEYAKAIALLEQGRRKVDREDALGLELGDVHAAAGDARRAAVEWSRGIGTEGRGFLLVQRRLQGMPDGGARIIPLLVEQLSAAPVTVGRYRAATVLAIDAGLDERAQKLVRDLAAMSRPQDREALFVELARRADGANLHRLAAWSYGQLLADAKNPGAMLAIQSRIAELALLAGDTALAKESYRKLEFAAAAGSPQRRQAVALRIQLTAREGNTNAAASELESFRAEYPQAPELSETASAIAVRMIAANDLESAERLLFGVTGATAALTRGRLFILKGEIEKARAELLTAAPQLKGAEATETIALASLLLRLSPQGGDIVARVAASRDTDRGAVIASAMVQSTALDVAERAAVLDFLAGASDRAGLFEDADSLRRQIVALAPRSSEAPAALLALARRSLGEEGAAEEAGLLLEKLILEYPRSTLAPQARSELQRLHARSTAR